MSSGSEELLEPIARAARFRQGLRFLPRAQKLRLVDLGCGPSIRFYAAARAAGVVFEKYIGIDPLLEPDAVSSFVSDPVVELRKTSFDARLPLPDQSADCVVSFASLEHVDHPTEMMAEAIRILKIGGVAIFTTPSKKSKRLLEFLSFRLGIISPREIGEHKNYFDRATLLTLAAGQSLPVACEHRYFEFGLNNLFVVRRTG